MHELQRPSGSRAISNRPSAICIGYRAACDSKRGYSDLLAHIGAGSEWPGDRAASVATPCTERIGRSSTQDHSSTMRLVTHLPWAASKPTCEHCGADPMWYHGCRDRHCPQCQGRATRRWSGTTARPTTAGAVLPRGIYLAARSQWLGRTASGGDPTGLLFQAVWTHAGYLRA